MVWIPPGAYVMGSEEHPAWDARPRRRVNVAGFWIDRSEVTNEEFEEFVRQTGHITLAERMNAAEPLAKAPPRGTASVFDPRAIAHPSPDNSSCWKPMGGADWRHPEGPGSTIVGRERHPVVHVSWDDAAAYARWAGKRLPTEAEWERAARGGMEGQRFVWGDTLRPGGRWMANVAHDGAIGQTAPVGRFPSNRYGLYDMSGNVWEWCADAYRLFPGARMGGPPEPTGFMRSMRGGSFLCSEGGCAGYVLGFRGKWEPDRPASHIGFRCAKAAD